MKVNKYNYKQRKETKDCKNKRQAYINFQYNLDKIIKEIQNQIKRNCKKVTLL